MGLLDFFKNQPQMADPHANARRLMGGAVQAQPMAQPEVLSHIPTDGQIQVLPRCNSCCNPTAVQIGKQVLGQVR